MTKTIEELKKEKEDAEAAYIDSAKAADVALLAYDNAWDVRDAARTAYNAAKSAAKNSNFAASGYETIILGEMK
jgi:hypothetical protein